MRSGVQERFRQRDFSVDFFGRENNFENDFRKWEAVCRWSSNQIKQLYIPCQGRCRSASSKGNGVQK